MSSSVASLDGKCALVTGAATGIGKAIATALAAAGARVVVNHNHTPESAEKVAAAINAAGGTAMALAADVSSRAEYQAMVQRLLAAFGRWDILVNNAAVAITKPFPEVTEAELDLSYAVNVKGAFHGMQLAHARMAEEGRIITISSSTTALALPGYAVYDATKGAVEQFTRILAKDFGSRGITVNTVSPGASPGRGLPKDRACRGTSQVYSRADQQVRGLVKSARARPHAGRGRRTACGSGRGADEATQTRAARNGTAGWVRRMTSSPASSAGAGTRRPRAGTPPTRSPKLPPTRLSGAHQAITRRWRGPSVAVRETADGAHRP